MKNTLVLWVLFPFFLFGNTIKPTPSKIENVTVYLEGASLLRTASVVLKPGENKILLHDLSPDIDESSIQISGLNETTIRALRFKIDFLLDGTPSEAFTLLETKNDSLSVVKMSLLNEILGFEKELELLQNNQRLNSDATDLSLERVKRMSRYYRTRTTEIKNEIDTVQRTLQRIDQQLLKINSQMLTFQTEARKTRGEVALTLDSPTATQLVLKISYTIQKAGWFPMYDIKAKDTDTPISLQYKANVYQQSGTDWEQVKVVLATGTPNTTTSKPTLQAKYLNFVSKSYRAAGTVKKESTSYNPSITKVTGFVFDDSGFPLPGVNVILKGTSKGTQTDFDGKYMLDVQSGRELVYSYIGFEHVELPVHASIMNVSLEAGNQLEEVVITGYASEASYTGDMASKLERKVNGLAGSVSGVKIRGISSPSEQDLLYIIDGVPVKEGEYTDLPSELITNVEVLKGSAATALYGTKAANGVLIITTNGKEILTDSVTKEAGLTNTRFEIREKYTINSNDDITVIEINSIALPAEYKHYAAPELNENVFLTATIKNWENFDLLPGEANVYFDGSYSGKSYLDPSATSEALELSLGMDPNVVISRKKITNFKSKSFLGSNRIIDKGYEIHVKNNKQTAITLRIEDRIPISENKDIRVDVTDTGNSLFDEQTGILTWELNLKSRETTSEVFSYSVKLPKYKKINL